MRQEVAEDCSEFARQAHLGLLRVDLRRAPSDRELERQVQGVAIRRPEEARGVEAHGDSRITGVAIHPSASASSDGGSLSVAPLERLHRQAVVRVWKAPADSPRDTPGG